jgi:hypothetical protein
MISRKKICFGAGILLASCCLGSMRASAELFSGVAATPNSWVFARFDCGCPPCMQGCGIYPYRAPVLDFELGYVTSPPIGWVLFAPYGVVPLGATPIDSVKAAPTDGYVDRIAADLNEELQVGRTYVVRTYNGGHAVISPAILQLGLFFTFVYRYQSDGSGQFEFDAGTRPVTWGAMKLVSDDSME